MAILAAGGLAGIPLAVDALSAAKHLATGSDEGCRVVTVIDGDTVGLWCGGTGIERARLTGFDTPEKFSPRCLSELVAAERATWGLRWMILRADRLSIVTEGRDRYDRRLAMMSLDGEPVSQAMIHAGLARAYDGGRRDGWCG